MSEAVIDAFEPVGRGESISVGGDNDLTVTGSIAGLASQNHGFTVFFDEAGGIFSGYRAGLICRGVVDDNNFVIGTGKVLPGEGF